MRMKNSQPQKQVWKCRRIFLRVVLIIVLMPIVLWIIHNCWKNAVEILPMLVKKIVNKSHYLCIQFDGGLGNQMFEYASIYGIAAAQGFVVSIPSKSYMNRIFTNLSATKVTSDRSCSRYASIEEIRGSKFDPKFLKLKNDRNYRLARYLQSWRYFKGYERDIEHQFMFNSLIEKNASTYFNKYVDSLKLHNQGKVNFVGVHVRRGDMTKDRLRSYGYNTPDEDYFYKAMAKMRQLFRNCVFLISSNDKQWVAQKIVGPNITVISEDHSAEVDLDILRKCNHTITSVGTFSWWAGFFTKGLVIYYRYPAVEGRELRGAYSADMNDFFYPGWMSLE